MNHYARAGSFTTKVGSPGEQAWQFLTPEPLGQQRSSLLSLSIGECFEERGWIYNSEGFGVGHSWVLIQLPYMSGTCRHSD